MTDPQPLTDDELVATKALIAAAAKPSFHQLRRLVATVEQTRRERDAAREALAAARTELADAIRRARATTEETSQPLRSIDDLLSPEQQAALNADLARMSRQRRAAETAAGDVPMARPVPGAETGANHE